jgi:hypothetical protein
MEAEAACGLGLARVGVSDMSERCASNFPQLSLSDLSRMSRFVPLCYLLSWIMLDPKDLADCGAATRLAPEWTLTNSATKKGAHWPPMERALGHAEKEMTYLEPPMFRRRNSEARGAGLEHVALQPMPSAITWQHRKARVCADNQ